MTTELKAVFLQPDGSRSTDSFCEMNAERVLRFHKSLPEYKETELVSLPELADSLGLESVQIKDESSRFGLNAFKGLGGSYCIARYLAEKFNIPEDELCFDKLNGLKQSRALKGLRVVTATDGNHGRGLAWAAKLLGIGCTVYMPKGSSDERLRNIRAQGADARMLELNYDDCVRYAGRMARENGWVLMQDTSVEGFENSVERIMQGYTTMAAEIKRQWQGKAPTHIFLQAGVGAMAGAMAACLADIFSEAKPMICVVEASEADCIFKTAEANDGKLHFVGGDLNTIMAGLACGEPCERGWEELRQNVSCFISATDGISALGMRRLAQPLGEDKAIVSGESGAVTTGAVIALMERAELWDIREKLSLGASSRVLLISTEGATDTENYNKITKKHL